jgi:RNA polymerase sigma-70 factor (sigma-E family)
MAGVEEVLRQQPAPAPELDDEIVGSADRLEQAEYARRAVVSVEPEAEVMHACQVRAVVGIAHGTGSAGYASLGRDGEMLSARAEGATTAPGGRLGELYLRYADGATRLAYLLTGDRQVAEDIVQDAFVKLAGRLAHLRDPNAFDAYLRRTVVNLSRSYWRRLKVERSYLKREQGAIGGEAISAPSSLEDRELLWTAMGRLSDRQRAAIVLRFYEDLSEADAAEILRCRPGTVKSLVSRGLEAMRQEITGADR